MDTIDCNLVIEGVLQRGNAEVAKHFKSDVINLKAVMQQPVDDIVKTEIEELRKSVQLRARRCLIV
jgi:hypothetical protein